jgi:hypothetical protein
MSVVLKNYNIFISSKHVDDDSVSKSNFNITLPDTITLNGEIPSKFIVAVKKATIPFSFHQYNQFNTTTHIVITRNSIDFPTSFIIKSSNYDIISFKDEFINKLIAAVQSACSYTPVITGTYDYGENKIEFLLTSDGIPTSINFNNSDGFQFVNLALGFTTSWILNDIQSTISNGNCNVSPARNIYIFSNTIIPSNIENLNSNKMQYSTLLASIPIYTTTNSYIQYDPMNALENDLLNNNIRKINIELRTENQIQNIPDLYVDWSLILNIKEVTMPQMIDKYMAIKQDEIDTKNNLNILNNQKTQILNDLDKLRNKTKKSLDNIKDANQQTQEEENSNRIKANSS